MSLTNFTHSVSHHHRVNLPQLKIISAHNYGSLNSLFEDESERMPSDYILILKMGVSILTRACVVNVYTCACKTSCTSGLNNV